MKRILFYISGHGYGHTTRCLEIIKYIYKQHPDTAIHIQSNGPRWLYTLNLDHDFTLIPKICDIGAVQNSSYNVDQQATLAQFTAFYQTFDRRIEVEANFILKNQIQIVVGDIPPLAFLAANRAGVPSIAITNFSWDWIYQPYTERYPDFEWLIREIKNAYGKADLLLQLPLAGNLSAFPHRLRIPLIARKAEMSRNEVRKQLEIDADINLVLVALRKEDLMHIHLDRLAGSKDHLFLFFTPVANHSNFRSVPADILPFQNLVSASDAVVSKPGYGIVSECIANKTHLFYAPREHFREYEILTQEISKLGMGKLIPKKDFFEGRWLHHLKEAPAIRMESVPHHGAEIAAKHILQFSK